MRRFWLGIVLTLAGCEASVPFTPDGEPPVAALNAPFTPDSAWAVRLIGATPYGTGSPVLLLPPIEGARVSVRDLASGETTDLQDRGSGGYRAETTPAAGRRYEITARLPGGETLRAVGETPPLPAFRVVSVEPVGRSETAGVPVALYAMTLRLGAARADESLSPHFYRTDDPPDPAPNTFPLGVFFTTDDPNLRQSFTDDGSLTLYPELAGGGVYLSPIRTDRTLRVLMRLPLPAGVATPSVRVEATALSAELRRYLATVALQGDRGGNPFVEPVRVFSNVEGGAGVFGGYAARDTVVVLPAP